MRKKLKHGVKVVAGIVILLPVVGAVSLAMAVLTPTFRYGFGDIHHY